MRVTVPVPITPLKLTSSTAADVFAPTAYAGGTTYAYGAIVSVAADYANYESLEDSNTGNAPGTSPLWWRKLGGVEAAYNAGTSYALGATCSANQRVYESRVGANQGNPLPVLPETETEKWIDVGATNKYAMFDLNSNTQTVSATDLTVVFAPKVRCNTLAVLGMVSNAITVSATSVFGGGTVYGPKTVDLNSRLVVDAYDYAFAPFTTNPSVVFFDLPPLSDVIITITWTSTSGNVKVGSVVAGNWIWIGDAVNGASSDAINFSKTDRDAYGTATLIPRRSVPKIDVKLWLPASSANRVRAARADLNAKVALYTGLDDNSKKWFDTLAILGFYKTWRIDLDDHDNGTEVLEVEEI